jgi:hypothetical protein
MVSLIDLPIQNPDLFPIRTQSTLLIGRGGFDRAGASWMVSDCPAAVSLYIGSPGRFIRRPHLVAQFVGYTTSGMVSHSHTKCTTT